MMAIAKGVARSGRRAAMGGAVWVTCAARMACGVVPMNGGCPTSIS